MAAPWPTELRLHKDRKTLDRHFRRRREFRSGGRIFARAQSSAEVQGHSPNERRTVAGKQDVQILELHPVGNYAVRLVFDDMHATGLFSWDYLAELGRKHEQNWRDYLAALAEARICRGVGGRSPNSTPAMSAWLASTSSSRCS